MDIHGERYDRYNIIDIDEPPWRESVRCHLFVGNCACIVVEEPDRPRPEQECLVEEAERSQPRNAVLEKSVPGKEWVRLFVVWVCTALAAGLMPGQPVFASMFADNGVYGMDCEDVPCDKQLATLNFMLGLGMMLSIVAQLPCGLLFDMYGGRAVGAAGACVVAVGLFLESIPVLGALNGRDSETSWIVPVAALITDFGSILNSYCFFSLVWHYPGSTNVVLSLSTATYQVSALLPVVLGDIMEYTGVNFGYAMLGYAGMVLLSAPVIWRATPSQQEYYDRAKEVLGVPLPKPKASFEICSMIHKGWVAMRLDIRDHLCLGIGFSASSTFVALYANNSAAYGKYLFGSKDAGKDLAVLQVKATAIIGAICAPFVAKIVDYLGLQRFAWLLTFFVAVPLALFYVESWWAAWVTTSGLTLYNTLIQLFYSRYLLCYAPPNRLGAYGGVFGLFMMAFYGPIYFGSYAFVMSQPAEDRYFLPYLSVGSFGVIGCILFNLRFCVVHDGNGVPRMPHLLPEDELELAMPFGAKNLDQVSDILGLDKEVLFKRLADQSPENLAELMSMIDSDKLAQTLQQNSPEDVIAMLEAQPEEDEDEPKQANLPIEHAVALDKSASASRSHLARLSYRLREMFEAKDVDIGERKAMMLQAKNEANDDMLYHQALSEAMELMVQNRNEEGCKRFILEVPIEDQWNCMLHIEEQWDESRQKELEKTQGKLITKRVFAGLVRQRPELKDLVSRMMKRDVQKMKERITRIGRRSERK